MMPPPDATGAAAGRAAAQQLQEAAVTAKQRKASKACLSGQVRNLLAQLIVSLWRAACLTKHFKTARKGNDSFHPFAAGILYQLKRGLYLADGTCIVPVLEELAEKHELPKVIIEHRTVSKLKISQPPEGSGGSQPEGDFCCGAVIIIVGAYGISRHEEEARRPEAGPRVEEDPSKT